MLNPNPNDEMSLQELILWQKTTLEELIKLQACQHYWQETGRSSFKSESSGIHYSTKIHTSIFLRCAKCGMVSDAVVSGDHAEDLHRTGYSDALSDVMVIIKSTQTKQAKIAQIKELVGRRPTRPQ